MESLDRALGNKWCSMLSKCQCINEFAIGSDHSPIVILLNHSDQRGRRRFRFEEMWMDNEECFDISRRSWQDGGPTCHMGDFKLKMEVCKRSLIEWRKKEFKHNIIEINKVKDRLNSMGNQPLS